ncbi:MAG: hypothetical protein JSR15_09995 [Proteobacteria bacterium]|nr:hypothetical protein [Pseudomonadota bacterium]
MTRRNDAASGRSEHGQALALLLMLLAAVLGSLLFVFNSGQIVAAKIRLVGAADAAAYSGALAEARSLNFQSYMNRAIVANEVAIAQFVSLRSWSGYVRQALQEAATVGSLYPPVGGALRAVAQSWNAVDRGLQRTLPPLESAASRWNVDVLSSAETLSNVRTTALAGSLARDVAVANVPAPGAVELGREFIASNTLRWQQYTQGHGRTGDERARLRDVVMESRDGFTRARGWTLGLPPLLALRKRGGTDLIGYDAWRGMDTLSLRVAVLFGHHETPLAWNAAENRQRPEYLRGDHGGSYRDNPRASSYAESGLVARSGYAGLPAYRDVRTGRSTTSTPLRFDVEVHQDGGTIETSDVVLNGAATVVPGEDPKRVQPAYHTGNVYALSAAQVVFRRPVGRADRRPELASLFNPYWQARLVPVTRSQRLAAAAAHGGEADPFLVLP